MELKVWVDGIQRVVCGVTEASTCQDVVYALAHATGQTGRFTLVEKWRNSERLLAPQEQPLKVLTKWGEYANDVHFLMRRSDSKQPPQQNNAAATTNNNNKRQHDFLRSFSPSNKKIPLVNSKEIKKSLTFSCGHGGSGSSGDASSMGESAPRRSKQDLPKGVVRGVPQQKPRQELERPKHPPSYDEAVSRSSGRFPTSQLSLANSPSSLDGGDSSPSSKRPHLAPRPANSHNNKLDQKTGSSPIRAKSPPAEKPPSEDSLKLKKPPVVSKVVDGGEVKGSESNKTLLLGGNKNGQQQLPHEEPAARDPQYQDLLRLVSLQREKLDNQQSELSQFDAEILYWENRLQEQEEKLSILQEEVCHLERTQHEQEGELIQLDRRSFSEEVDLGRQEERTLRSELTLARSQLANCETELLQCRQRIRLLLEDIAEERRKKNLREEQERKEQEEQERNLQTQLDCIQQQLKEKTIEADSQKAVAEQAKEELNDLEIKLEDKEKELGKLMADIREANLRSLSLIPSEEGKLVLEGNFHNRPGSTRKIIGSPRQLENAVPTNKNPHGVWV